MKMKVVWIVPHFPPHIGGGEQLYLAVCKGLRERGVEVRVITGNSGGITGRRNVEGVDVIYCNWRLLFGHPVVKAADIRDHVEWCDLVHTTIYSTAVKSYRAAKKSGKPCVLTLHEVMDEKWKWFVKNPLKAFLFRMYEKQILMHPFTIQAVSEATRRDYVRFCSGSVSGKANPKIYRIYNFLDLPPVSEVNKEQITYRGYFSLSENERSILYFGRPASNKGIFVLLEAIRIFRERITSVRSEYSRGLRFCLLLSENPADQHREVLKKIEEYDISSMLKIRPSLPRLQLLKVISEAECCVVPSITEGFGFSAAEACAYGRPLISSDAGSLPEVVSGRCMFFANRDAENLAEKLLRYEAEGDNAFENVPYKHFDREKVIDEYLGMYRDILQTSGGGMK